MKIRKKISVLAATLLLLFAAAPALASAASCSNNTSSTKSAITSGADCASGNSDNNPQSLDTTAKSILNLLSTIVGVAAVFMIIFSGLRYITSGGDAEKVKTAKRTLLYALVGLAIVALTQTIVHLVLTEASHPNQVSIMLRL